MKPFWLWRYGIVLFLNLVGFAVISIFLMKLVQDSNDEIKLKTSQVYKRKVVVSADRGDIYDDTGQLLAGTKLLYDVWIDPLEFEASLDQIESLASILNMHEDTLLAKINQLNNRYVVIAKDISEVNVEKIRDLHNKTFHLESRPVRYYPLGAAVSTVLGLVDNDLQGIDGIELSYNHSLSGKNGYREILKDRHGHTVKYIDEKLPVPGKDIQLTLDSRLQYMSHNALENAVATSNAEAATAVIIHIPTGEIKAMVNWPTFDPNDRNHLELNNVKNRAVTDLFEPGSTMKPFAMAHLLETKAWSVDDKVDVSKGYMKMDDGHVIRDVHVNKNPIVMQEVLQKSSNVAVAKMMSRKPSYDFIQMLPQLGFCTKTINDLPGEINGICHANYDGLFALSTLSFGYGIGVNTLQLAQAYSVFANDGIFHSAYIEKGAHVEDSKRVIRPEIAKTISQMLLSVVKRGGTGTRATINGVEIAGKTGTSYLVGKNGYDHSKHLSSFVGFAPVDKPQYVVAVVLRNPDHAYRYGGVAAAPVFAEMMLAALGYRDDRSI